MKLAVFISIIVFSVSAFAELDKRFYAQDDESFKQQIIANKVSVSKWIDDLNSNSVDFLCLGESHTDEYRKLYSEKIFSSLILDQLYLETDVHEGNDILSKIAAGQERVEMLCHSDIAGLLRASQKVNPEIEIFGVDETDEQKSFGTRINYQSGRDFITRDGFISQNIMSHIKKGQRHLALYGSTHCARNDIGLGRASFFRILEPVFAEADMKAKSVIVIMGDSGGHFDLMMQILGLSGESFVIPDTAAIDPASFNYKWELRRIFDNYDSVIYFAPEKKKNSGRRSSYEWTRPN
jgi:hypothetical protein